MQPTMELRFVKRDLKAHEVYNGRGFKYVLQQRWVLGGTNPWTYKEKDSEWRDVPMVEEG